MPPSCVLLGGFAIGAWVALLGQHWKCVAEPSSYPPGPPHAAHTIMPAKTPLTSDKIDVSAACMTLSATTPLHFVHTAGDRVVTQTRNVSKSLYA